MKMFLIFFLFPFLSYANYNTPNDGVEWDLDSLVFHSGGIVTGTFPNYVFNDSLIISENDKLIITPGSKLDCINSDVAVIIYGRFDSQGSLSDSIYFNNFRSIIFRSILTDSITKITFSNFTDNDLILCWNVNLNINNCSFITSDIWIHNPGGFVIKNQFINNKNLIIIDKESENDFLFESNKILNGGLVQLGILNSFSKKLFIKKNRIYSNDAVSRIGIRVMDSFKGEISENEIFGDSIGIHIWNNSRHNFTDGLINGNIIYNNKHEGILIWGEIGCKPIISENEIFNNNVGIKLENIVWNYKDPSGPIPNLGNIENNDSSDDGKNIFYGNSTYDLMNYSYYDIYAQNNDWRYYDSASIEDKIYHKQDWHTLSLVKFIPFLNPLPVEFVSINANLTGNNLELKWTTATEVNNKGFEIYRKDIETNTTWKLISSVPGKGTSTEKQNYIYIDSSLSEGKYQYQLKQVDFNGNFSYSSTINVEVNTIKKYELDQNYPNPFNPITVIQYQIPESELVNLKLYNILGKEIATLVNKEQPVGKYRIELNSTNFSLPSGIYFYTLKVGNFFDTKKMILVK